MATTATAIPTTLVTFPGGATQGSSTVLAVLPAGAHDAGAPEHAEHAKSAKSPKSAKAAERGELVGLVVDTTPFHPLDHSWPDQPGDSGTLEAAGARYTVVDCVTGGCGPDGVIALGADIPARRGDEGWTWLAVHLVEAPAAAAAELVGTPVVLRVDTGRRAALSAAHTGCHLLALALNAELAPRWRKPVRTDGLGAPDFDSLAMESSRMDVHASTDRYRIGKSLRKKGFDPEGLTEQLPELNRRVNERLAGWVAADVPVRIEAEGPELSARRCWICELPEGTAAIHCGGTHVSRAGELESLTTTLTLSEDGTELVAITVPKRA